ncbi:lysine N(6)-hydroxylase/L-ornithine N(5)-oxygenase family protein [Streptomyces desertarenae]|uniref:L-lysine N6-monooxygenase MbtG n=1 Tax=Streptomyces desertarenae TaxID=2666184 RepID=A0ABW4PKF7_9ACTN
MPETPDPEVTDYVAIGAGPANLSLAAQAEAVPGLRGIHLERQREFAWHPGLLLPGAVIQISPLKDLVTPVDPTSDYSFPSFLVSTGRFYDFLSARFPAVHRAEYNEYLAWAARRLPTVRFGHEVREVHFRGDHFEALTDHGAFRGRHLVLGTGGTPAVPAVFREHLGERVFHAENFLRHEAVLPGRRVAVVGGGQSGAEIVRHLLAAGTAEHIAWVSRRPGFVPLDESAFANHLYHPEAAREFFGRSPAERTVLLRERRYTSDGISESLLAEIYQRIYLATHVEGRTGFIDLLPGYEVVGAAAVDDGYRLTLKSVDSVTSLDADAVVLATGYEQHPAPCTAPLAPRLRMADGAPVVREDFSVEWDGPDEHRIYLQNGARHAFGVADPNLSLVAWRSKVILDSIRDATGTRPKGSVTP